MVQYLTHFDIWTGGPGGSFHQSVVSGLPQFETSIRYIGWDKQHFRQWSQSCPNKDSYPVTVEGFGNSEAGHKI